MNYEWIEPPELVPSECDECGHVEYYKPEQPRLGPLTLGEQRKQASARKAAEELARNYRAIYAEALDGLLPDADALLKRLRAQS